MTQLGKYMFFAGILIAVLGLLIWGAGRLGFRGLPGDITYEGRNTRIYFPIVTCIVLSVLATAAVWLWRWFTGR